ncbi:AGC family protein kinase, partial [Trichomonas vaginalis G3]
MESIDSCKFSIETEGSTEPLYFRAPSTESLLQWIHALRSCTYTHQSLTIESFKVLSVLGRGNYGKVMLAEKIDSGELFAIKSVHKKRLALAGKVHTMLSERNTLINASNPFIVKLFYAFQNATKFYLVLEYVPGGEMFNYMSTNGAVPLEDARIYAAEIVTALHFLHQNDIIYRDLKPENILLAQDGHIKLTDFGFAKDLSQSEVTKTFCGTNEYLAPEVISRVNYGPAVDWWTLGILLYEMLFQTTPFFHQNTSRMFTRILMDPVVFPKGADPDVCSLIT